MNKSKIFAEVLSIVSFETDVKENEILSINRSAEVVDARYMLVKSLYDYGFYPIEIARRMNKTQRNVNHILNNFDARLSYMKHLGNCYARIRKSIGNKCFVP